MGVGGFMVECKGVKSYVEYGVLEEKAKFLELSPSIAGLPTSLLGSLNFLPALITSLSL